MLDCENENRVTENGTSILDKIRRRSEPGKGPRNVGSETTFLDKFRRKSEVTKGTGSGSRLLDMFGPTFEDNHISETDVTTELDTDLVKKRDREEKEDGGSGRINARMGREDEEGHDRGWTDGRKRSTSGWEMVRGAMDSEYIIIICLFLCICVSVCVCVFTMYLCLNK